MKYDTAVHHRRSIRLRGYDYSLAGAYFMTICTQSRTCLFGEIVNGEMVLNDAGRIAQKCWLDIPTHFPHAELDEFVVMPNHIHGIVVITGNVGAKNFSPLHKYSPQRACAPQRACVPQGHRPSGTSKTIGSIVRGFKIGVTKWMRANTPVHDVWQRNYYEHIVRNNNELNRIHEYIAGNPARWESDHLNLNVPSGISGVRESDAEYARETWMT